MSVQDHEAVRLLSGNEAIARGAYEAGVKVAAAYPGTPSTEILEYLAELRRRPRRVGPQREGGAWRSRWGPPWPARARSWP